MLTPFQHFHVCLTYNFEPTCHCYPFCASLTVCGPLLVKHVLHNICLNVLFFLSTTKLNQAFRILLFQNVFLNALFNVIDLLVILIIIIKNSQYKQCCLLFPLLHFLEAIHILLVCPLYYVLSIL